MMTANAIKNILEAGEPKGNEPSEVSAFLLD